jgi:hypothetical protein
VFSGTDSKCKYRLRLNGFRGRLVVRFRKIAGDDAQIFENLIGRELIPEFWQQEEGMRAKRTRRFK